MAIIGREETQSKRQTELFGEICIRVSQFNSHFGLCSSGGVSSAHTKQDRIAVRRADSLRRQPFVALFGGFQLRLRPETRKAGARLSRLFSSALGAHRVTRPFFEGLSLHEPEQSGSLLSSQHTTNRLAQTFILCYVLFRPPRSGLMN